MTEARAVREAGATRPAGVERFPTTRSIARRSPWPSARRASASGASISRPNRVRGTAQFFRIMGLEPTNDSVPVEAIRALRHPEDRDRVVAGFRKALDGGDDAYEIEYRIIRPDGNLRWIFGRGRVIRDATARRFATAASISTSPTARRRRKR